MQKSHSEKPLLTGDRFKDVVLLIIYNYSNYVDVTIDYLLHLYGSSFGKIVIYSELPVDSILNTLFPLSIVSTILNYTAKDSNYRFLPIKKGNIWYFSIVDSFQDGWLEDEQRGSKEYLC